MRSRVAIVGFLALLLGLGCTPYEGGPPGQSGPPDDDGDDDNGDDDDTTDPYLGDDDDSDGINYPNHGVPPGGIVLDGLLLDVTPDGLDFVENLALHMDSVDLPMSAMTQDLGEYEGCDTSITISNLRVHLDFTHLEVRPIAHGLDLELGITVSINDNANPFDLGIDLDGGIFGICGLLDENCDMWVEPMNISLSMALWLDVIDPGGGTPAFIDAVVSTPEHNLRTALTADHIGLSGCLIATINDILNFFGTDIVEMLIDEASGELFAFLENDLPREIETAIEDGFDSATANETVDVMGVPLELRLEPRGLMIEDEGIRVQMNSSFFAPAAECIEAFDPMGSPFRNIAPPDLDPTAHHHVSAFVSQDMFDAMLYTVWRGGLLCYEVDPAELGVPLDTSILGMMVEEDDRELVDRIWMGESQPLVISTMPAEPPYLRYAGSNDLMIEVQNLGLDFFALTQDRQARVMGMGLDANAGLDLDALGDGGLGIDVVLDTAQLAPLVEYDEMLWPISDQIETNFGGLVSGMVDPILDSVVGDLALGPFDVGGVGITALEIVPAGPTGGYMGTYLAGGVVDPAASCELGGIGIGCGEGGGAGCEGGCGEMAGCSEDASCEEGTCSTARARRVRGIWAGNALLLLACVAAIAGHRRRSC